MGDIIMLDTPNYAMDISGAMKNLLDHLAYRWVTHRPHGSMFAKVGIVVSSSAGAPPNAALKSLSTKLKWMCVPRVYRFALISGALGIKDLSEAKKAKIESKAQKLAQKTRKAAAHPRASLRTKSAFLLFRNMQRSASAGIQPTGTGGKRRTGLKTPSHGGDRRLVKGGRMQMKSLLIWGAGDQGTVALECALAMNVYESIDFLGLKEKERRDIPGYVI